MQTWPVIGASLSITNRERCISASRNAASAIEPWRHLPRLADLAPTEANVLQFPVTEASQYDKVCLVLTMRDHGGNPAIDEASKARQKNPECPSNGGRGRSVV